MELFEHKGQEIEKYFRATSLHCIRQWNELEGTDKIRPCFVEMRNCIHKLHLLGIVCMSSSELNRCSERARYGADKRLKEEHMTRLYESARIRAWQCIWHGNYLGIA